jgi:hypothetical protein
MRISHVDLEACVASPSRWYLSSQTASSHGYKMGYERVLRLSIFHFHKSDAQDARRYMIDVIKRNDLSNAARVSQIENALESYIHWASTDPSNVADTQVRILFPHGFLELRGEISRVDVTVFGYRAILLSAPPIRWREQLRMPLIQRAISSMYSRPVEKVEVGFQQLDGTGLQTAIFNRKQIDAAAERFLGLGKQIRRLVKNAKES